MPRSGRSRRGRIASFEEEEVAEVRVSGTRRSYWVGLRSKKVLSRTDLNLGVRRTQLRLAAIAAAMGLPPLVLGLIFGGGGAAFGLFIAFLVLLGIVVFFSSKTGSAFGMGK